MFSLASLVLKGCASTSGCWGADTDYKLIGAQPQTYPTMAGKNGVSGSVLVEFDIDSFGFPYDIRVVEAEPSQIFDEAAIEAVRNSRFSPRVVNCTPQVVENVLFRINFELGDSAAMNRQIDTY